MKKIATIGRLVRGDSGEIIGVIELAPAGANPVADALAGLFKQSPPRWWTVSNSDSPSGFFVSDGHGHFVPFAGAVR